MKRIHLDLVPPRAEPTLLEPPPPPGVPWWEAPEFLALAELRLAMVGGAPPPAAPETAEESARYAVFWVLSQVEHLFTAYRELLEAGEPVRIRTGVYVHTKHRVDFNLRIVEHAEAAPEPPPPGGAR